MHSFARLVAPGRAAARPLLLMLALAIVLAAWAGAVAPAAAEGPSELFYLPIRYRSQFDGTAYQAGNCGPTSLAMVVSAMRDEHIKTTEIRQAANVMQGTFGIYDSGTSLDVLAAIGRRYGAVPMGLYDGKGYHQWTLDEVREHLRAGHPIIPQVHFVKLPGHEYESPVIDHYIVLIGTSGDNFVYHDPAFNGGAGQSLVITADRLKKAWAAGDFGFAAVAFRPDATLPSLLPTPVPTLPPAPTRTPVPTLPPAATPTATAVPPTPTPTVPALVAQPAAGDPGLIERLFGGGGLAFGWSGPPPSPTPDTSAWQIGGARSDRSAGLSARGEARPTTALEDTGRTGEALEVAAGSGAPPPAAALILLLPLLHLARTRLAARSDPGAIRRR